MSEFYAAAAAQYGNNINLEPWYPSINDLQMILDDMEKQGHKKTTAYNNLQNFLYYARAKSRYSARPPRVTIK